MTQDTIGNLVIIEGDNEKIKKLVLSLLRDDPGRDDGKSFDFSKIIPVNNTWDETECDEKWGVSHNATDTQYYFEGENNPPSNGNFLYFNSHDVPSKILEELAKQYPNISFSHEWSDDDAYKAGFATYESGVEVEGDKYEPRSYEAVNAFQTMWGRYDEFVWNKDKKKFVHFDGEPEMN